MAPRTPKRKTERREYDTTKRMKFFQAWDQKNEEDGVGTVAHLPGIGVPTSTARSWLKTRDLMGDEAFRMQRKTSSMLGRPAKVSASDLKRLTNQDDPIHEKGWQEQADSCAGKPSAKTLQRHINNAGARRFKKRYQKAISKSNRPKRVTYGKEHEKKTVLNYWSWIWFTDEAHFSQKNSPMLLSMNYASQAKIEASMRFKNTAFLTSQFTLPAGSHTTRRETSYSTRTLRNL